MSDVAAIILAAGEGSRFRAAAGEDAPASKLVAEHRGEPLVRHVAKAALAAGLAPVIVVTGFAAEAVTQALDAIDVTRLHNPDYASGMASSLKRGVAAAPAQARGYLILLGDMPLVSADLIRRLLLAFEANPHAAAVAPSYQGERGNPVLLNARLAPELMKVTGDEGARALLRSRQAEVMEVAIDDRAARADVDTPDALKAL